MLAGIARRRSNALGRWACEHLALGHARLCVLDLDQRAGQPMHDPRTGNVIVFDGEIYNFRALRAGLEARGERFRTAGGTEVLLALYRMHGQDCLLHLRGMFAFALWDAALALAEEHARGKNHKNMLWRLAVLVMLSRAK